MRKLMTLMVALAILMTALAAPAAARGNGEKAEPTLFDLTSDRNWFDRNGDDFDILNIVLRVTKLKRVVDDANAGPFTVFAPTDQAFKDTAAAVCGKRSGRNELRATLCLYRTLGKDGLTNVVLNHVLDGEVFSKDVPGVVGADVPTLSAGNTIKPVATDGPLGLGLEFGGGAGTANIIAVDLVASNGVAHVLDTVMVP